MQLKRGGNDMEKKLKLIKLGENYILKLDDSDIEIKIEKLKISSQDIYDKLIKGATEKDTPYKFVIYTDLDGKDDQRVCKQIKTLFAKIETALNEYFESTQEKKLGDIRK